MTDGEALVAGIAADPENDLPRLVFADWLEEHGDAERAEFVRAQVRLAAVPEWDPFAVYCRHRQPEWTSGDPWRMSLPWVHGWAVEWHPDRAFRRGFGYSLIVRDLAAFLADASRIFDVAPVGELHLPTATLDQWRVFGRSPWLPRVKSVHFYGTTTPIEPVRVLCDSPLATGIEELVFEVCSRPGMPVLLEGLFQSELGRRLQRVELRSGPHDTSDILNVMSNETAYSSLAEVSIRNFGWPMQGTDWFVSSPLSDRIRKIDLRDCPHFLPSDFSRADHPFRQVKVLRANRCDVRDFGLGTFNALRLLDLSENPFYDYLPVRFRDQSAGQNLRSLSLRNAVISEPFLESLILPKRPFWNNLAELDLRANRITDIGASHLLDAEVPPEMTALLLAGNPISEEMRGKLRRHFGPAVLFDE